MQAALDDYSKYFDTLGFSVHSKKVRVRVEVDARTREGVRMLSSFDPSTESIVIDSSVVSDLDLPRREYSHFVLLKQRANTDEIYVPDVYLLESDLADYFVCSFAVGHRLRPVATVVLKLATPRTLDNNRTFIDLCPLILRSKKVEKFGVVSLWAIRKALNPATADKVAALAWVKMAAVQQEGEAGTNFIKSLLSAARDSGSPDAVSKVVKILQQRKFHVPS